MSLVETDWLEKNLNDVKIIDCSWHMPQTKRNGYEEYNKEHITGSIFFDLDKNSKKNTSLPHMLVDKNDWEKIVSLMGINQTDNIVIYDNFEEIKQNILSLRLIPMMTIGSIPFVLISWFLSYLILLNIIKSYKKKF